MIVCVTNDIVCPFRVRGNIGLSLSGASVMNMWSNLGHNVQF